MAPGPGRAPGGDGEGPVGYTRDGPASWTAPDGRTTDGRRPGGGRAAGGYARDPGPGGLRAAVGKAWMAT